MRVRAFWLEDDGTETLVTECSAAAWLRANREGYTLADVRRIRAAWEQGKSWYDGGGASPAFRVAPVGFPFDCGHTDPHIDGATCGTCWPPSSTESRG